MMQAKLWLAGAATALALCSTAAVASVVVVRKGSVGIVGYDPDVVASVAGALRT